MASEQDLNTDVIIRMFEETWNSGNLAFIDEVVADDFRDYPPKRFFTTPLQGKESLYDAVKGFRDGAPDFHFSHIRTVAEGDRVTHLGRATGTHTGTFFGVPPSGKSFSVLGINEFRLRDGKIVERWGVFDVMGLMMQIGLIPAPGGGGGHE
jgi:steroid delta-isomerase-like uncharacterized protein